MTPFDEAIQAIKKQKQSSTSEGLAKLILTLYNPVHPFSFGECIRSFDNERVELAFRMIRHYVEHGEDQSLMAAGQHICATWPTLIELSKAGSTAKADLLAKWREVLTEDIPLQD